MALHGSIDELSDLIARLQLAELGQLRWGLEAVGPNGDEAAFLEVLQRKQVLTAFQVEKLAKRDTSGLVLGGCKLLYMIAAGSFARVYRGARIDDNGSIGIKVLRDRWSKDADITRLFRREGELGQRLKHPHIVPIHSVGEESGLHFITMEFVEGGNLRDFLKIRGKLEPAEACQYGVQIADALQYALNLGITHRDLKLTNVLMSSQGTVKLIDFGLGADESTLNRADAPDLQQAVEYSTLERGSNAPRNDPRSDLYFLGTILYELLSGEPPYPRTKSREERKRFSRYRDVRPITSISPRTPHSVADVVDRLLHTNPNLRYQTAAEVSADLRSALKSLGVGSSQAAASATSTPGTPRILCIESRPKHQDLLRDYFSRHGYRVLLMTDAERAVSRIGQQAPDCLVLMAQHVEGDVPDLFERARAADSMQRMGAVLVLGENQPDLQPVDADAADRVRVLRQPVPLRALRKEVESLLKAAGVTLPQPQAE